jgi:hypothetical protein
LLRHESSALQDPERHATFQAARIRDFFQEVMGAVGGGRDPARAGGVGGWVLTATRGTGL